MVVTPIVTAYLQRYPEVSASCLFLDRVVNLAHNGERRTVRLQARMTTTTNDSAVAALVGGFGVTRLRSYQVAEHLRTGRGRLSTWRWSGCGLRRGCSEVFKAFAQMP